MFSLLVAMGASLAVSVSGPAAQAATSHGSSTLVTAWPADITTLDPANLSTNQDHELSRNLYETLLSPKFVQESNGSLEYQGADVAPELAK